MKLILVGIILLATCFDAYITALRVGQRGESAELNGMLRALYKFFGVNRGLFVGLIIPNVAAIVLLYPWLVGLSFFAGMKFSFACVQFLAWKLNPEGKV